MKQKVIKIGSSIGVVLPKPLAEEMGFKAGQDINLKSEGKAVLIEHSAPQAKLAVDPQILQWGAEFIAKNRELLKRLKDN